MFNFGIVLFLDRYLSDYTHTVRKQTLKWKRKEILVCDRISGGRSQKSCLHLLAQCAAIYEARDLQINQLVAVR